jgi:hypothetical protein
MTSELAQFASTSKPCRATGTARRLCHLPAIVAGLCHVRDVQFPDRAPSAHGISLLTTIVLSFGNGTCRLAQATAQASVNIQVDVRT